MANMELSSELLAILACPSCHAKFAVDYDAKELVCSNQGCALAYPVRDNIPVLLIDQARSTL
ncbi:Trm112 family protein [Tessaracoccus sp. OH4464_COT-324]|uniref:Trm112 family protein n=1 Tax=Tessaracoccus sp. OH4464_COT-324 TaxID=2491059 RepID=UPI001F42CB30|nr:Trm112 family protein [Tessaracoccus sp. OH4464_COT-324]